MSDVEIKPCETCGSCGCLDAQISYWISKATRAEAALAKEKALTVYAIETRDAKIMERDDTIEKLRQLVERGANLGTGPRDHADLKLYHFIQDCRRALKED